MRHNNDIVEHQVYFDVQSLDLDSLFNDEKETDVVGFFIADMKINKDRSIICELGNALCSDLNGRVEDEFTTRKGWVYICE